MGAPEESGNARTLRRIGLGYDQTGFKDGRNAPLLFLPRAVEKTIHDDGNVCLVTLSRDGPLDSPPCRDAQAKRSSSSAPSEDKSVLRHNQRGMFTADIEHAAQITIREFRRPGSAIPV